MACNSNYVATVDSNCWLSSDNSPHQTMCAHMEEELYFRGRGSLLTDASLPK